MNYKHPLFIAFLFGVLFYLSWPPMPAPFLVFIIFVPLLLYAEGDFLNKQKIVSFRKFITTVFIFFFTFNFLSTWWVMNATPAGIIAPFLNAFLMSIPWAIYFYSKRKYMNWISNLLLVTGWISFEYLHLNWDLSWPWLTLGNIFAKWPSLIQWYEFTGHIGGTLWILLINILMARVIQYYTSTPSAQFQLAPKVLRMSAWVDMAILIPVIVSLIIDRTYIESDVRFKTTVVQPNIDPYTEKFNGLEAGVQIQMMLKQAAAKTDSSARLLIFPETAVTSSFNELDYHVNSEITSLINYIQSYPGLNILTGANTFSVFDASQRPTLSARPTGDGRFYDVYNTAVYLESQKKPDYYHKGKLVPGVEKMPFPQYLGFLEKWSVDLGGISGSLGTDSEAHCLGTQVKIAPVICYESIYGDYVRNFVLKGASLICIITNDGWWGNTDGYKQHFDYAVLRAIENRRSVARSANTGISGFINERGRVEMESQWWQPEVLSFPVSLQSNITFYTLHGDYICVFSLYIFISGFLLGLFFTKHNSSSNNPKIA